jgi:hypothetical protein
MGVSVSVPLREVTPATTAAAQAPAAFARDMAMEVPAAMQSELAPALHARRQATKTIAKMDFTSIDPTGAGRPMQGGVR